MNFSDKLKFWIIFKFIVNKQLPLIKITSRFLIKNENNTIC